MMKKLSLDYMIYLVITLMRILLFILLPVFFSTLDLKTMKCYWTLISNNEIHRKSILSFHVYRFWNSVAKFIIFPGKDFPQHLIQMILYIEEEYIYIINLIFLIL